MWTRPLLLVLFAALGCGSPVVPTDAAASPDAGLDAGASDAGQDAGDDAGLDAGHDAALPDAGPGTPFPMPVYYVSGRVVRSCCDPAQYGATLRLPAASPAAGRWNEWTFVGHVNDPRTADSVDLIRNDGDEVVVNLTITATSSEFRPNTDREIFTAVSPDGVVLTTSFEGGALVFTAESTARQALALAGVRPRASVHPDLYYVGASPGDDARIEAAVPTVAEAIRARLLISDSGVGAAGFARRDTEVFSRVDAAMADAASPTPTLTPASFDRIGTISLDGTEGLLALWLGDLGPAAPIEISPGTREVGFLFSITARLRDGDLVYARFLDGDGGQSPASPAFVLDAAGAPDRPLAPTVTRDDTMVRACGIEPGHWLIFFQGGYPGTQLATGFEASLGDADGCATMTAARAPGPLVNVFVGVVGDDLQLSPFMR